MHTSGCLVLLHLVSAPQCLLAASCVYGELSIIVLIYHHNSIFLQLKYCRQLTAGASPNIDNTWRIFM